MTGIISVEYPWDGDLWNEMCEKKRWRDLLMLRRVSDNLIIHCH